MRKPRTSIPKFEAPHGKTWVATSNHGEVLEHPELSAIFRQIGETAFDPCTWSFHLDDIYSTNKTRMFPQ